MADRKKLLLGENADSSSTKTTTPPVASPVASISTVSTSFGSPIASTSTASTFLGSPVASTSAAPDQNLSQPSTSSGFSSKSSKVIGGLAKLAYCTAANIVGVTEKYQEVKWICIGKVKKLMTYHIDGGRRYTSQKLECTANGPICKVAESNNTYDRTLIAYNTSGKAEIGPEVAELLPKFDKHIYNLLESTVISPYHPTIKINYLDTEILLQGFNENYSRFKKFFKSSDPTVRLGYISPEDRTASLSKIRRYNPELENNYVEGFLGNFSHYTLQSKESCQDLQMGYNSYLKDKINKKRKIDFRCFNPHIIVDKKFDEENIEYVKINDAVFVDVIPCAYTDSIINHYNNYTSFPLDTYLKNSRPLINAKFNLSNDLILPTFGINMEFDNMTNPAIKVGDSVYISYKKSKSLPPRK